MDIVKIPYMLGFDWMIFAWLVNILRNDLNTEGVWPNLDVACEKNHAGTPSSLLLHLPELVHPTSPKKLRA